MSKLFSISRLTNGIILFSLIWVIFNLGLFKQERKVIYSDVLEYYSYLPATFVYHDISLKFTDKDPTYFSDKFWPVPTPNGGKISKMSMGMAIVYSPFFFVAHAYAKLSGEEANGFTRPYRLAIQLSAVFYLAFGLYFLRKILLKYFSGWVTALAILSVTAGTNLYLYASIEAPMSHVYSFSLIAAFVFCTLRWYENPIVKNSIIIGLLGGLIALIRPSNCIIFLFFVLWKVSRWSDFIERMKLIFSKFGLILSILFFAFIVWIPQFIYWKFNTGHWLYYSYGDQHFFFNDPQFINGLFSYRKGWLLYTPIMVLALIGFIPLYRWKREFFLPVLIFSLLNFYIIVSWWTWWYAGGFGLRPMVDSYSLLIFPLASFIDWVMRSKLVIRVGGLAITSLLIFHSLFEVAQYNYGSIHYDSMNKASYWDSFGRLKPSAEFYKLIKAPDYDKALKGKRNE